MKNKKGLLLAGILLFSLQGFSQSFAETALLFSRAQTGGSARMQALGGAQVSLGGDYSSAFSNPAGLGMYNRSEFSFTPGQYTTSVSGDYWAGNNLISSNNNDTRSGINLSGLALVFSSEDGAKNSFIRGTFAVTLNRTNNFNRNFQYQGENPATSLIDYFIEDATGRNPNQFEEGGELFNTISELAYSNYLIGESTILDPNNNPEEYFTDIQSFAYQKETIQTRGAQNQWSFSYGANFDDKFFLGAGLGVASLRYESKKSYREDFENEPLSYFTLDEDLEIRGSAINLTVGGIARPVDFVQLGISMTTPTYYNLTDYFSSRMRSSWNSYDYFGDGSEILGNENASTDVITSEYNLSTPWRLNLGATFFLKKYGFVTADIEQVNYAQARYGSDVTGIEFSSDNDKIRSLYRPVTNLRFGSEFRINEWRVRGGYQFMPDPFNTEQNGVSRKIQTLSGGFGYRTSTFFMDLAVIYASGQNSYRPYRVNSDESPLLTYHQKSTSVLVTLGFPF
jgi:hypothetical protein